MSGSPLPRFIVSADLQGMVDQLNSFVEQLDERLSSEEQSAGRDAYAPTAASRATTLPTDMSTATTEEVGNVLNTLIADLKAAGKLT